MGRQMTIWVKIVATYKNVLSSIYWKDKEIEKEGGKDQHSDRKMGGNIS